MRLFSTIKQKTFRDFADIIEWIVHTPETIIWRFTRYKAGIKNGAKLIVRDKQVAVLANKNQFADVYQPGEYELTPINMPVISTLKGWKYGYNSPFKVDVYFVNTKEFLNFSWGTNNPIMVPDTEFGPIRMSAYGSYSFRVQDDPIIFIRNVVGQDGKFTTESVIEQLRKFVIKKFTDYLHQSKIASIYQAANLNGFSSELTKVMKEYFSEYGIELTKFSIEKISLPDAVEAALDQRTCKGVVGKMATYTQMHFADTLKNAVNN